MIEIAMRPATPDNARRSPQRDKPMEARDIFNLVQARVKRVLDYAELAVPADKFERFRTLVFNEFGYEGLRKDLARLLGEADGLDRHGKGRNDGRKGGAP